MKTLTKKAIVLASAIAVASTFAVCAAEITISSVNADLAKKSVAVNYTLPETMAASDQVTILAYQVTTEKPTPVAENIVYIDQVDKSATDGSYEFTLRDGFGAGNYKVLMGGTGLSGAGWKEFTIAPAQTGYTVSGTVGSLKYFGDPSEDPAYSDVNSLYQTTATLWKSTLAPDYNMADAVNKISSVVIDASDVPDALSGAGYKAFDFTGVENGNYFITLSQAGKCTCITYVTVSNGNCNIGTKNLMGADTTGNYVLDAEDVGETVDAWYDDNRNMYGASGFDPKFDPTANGVVDAEDVGATVDSWLKFENEGNYHILPPE